MKSRVRNRTLLIVLALTGLHGPAARAADVPPSPATLVWHTVGLWRQPQGLPQNSIRSMIQTRDGYLWLGTNGGLARFDGVRFTTYDDRNPAQLRENEVWALLEGRDGSLWIGTYGGGLSRLKDGRFTVFTTRDGLVNDTVAALCEDHEGGIWVGTDLGLSRYHDGRFTNITEGLVYPKIRAVYTDTDGSVWIGGFNGGVNRFKDGRLQRPVLDPAPKDEIRGFARTRDGALWIATFGGLWRVETGRARRFTIEDGLASNAVHSLHEDAEGRFWIATDNGLHRYDEGRFLGQSIDYAQPHRPHLTRVMSDREGSLWVGTWSQGVAHLRRSRFTTWGSRNGLAGDYVSTVLEDARGDVWVGTNTGLSVFRGGTSIGPMVPGGAALNVISLARDRDGRVLIGTKDGVWVAGGSGPLSLLPGTAGLYARVIYVDGAGVIWIGTDSRGLARHDGRLTTFTTKDGLSSDAVRAVAPDETGALWIGTRGGGLNRYANGQFAPPLTRKDGLPSDAIMALHQDEGDPRTLWIATRQGVTRYRDGVFKTLTVEDGLFASFVYSFLENAGQLWMTCSKGIFRVSKQELHDRADGKRGPVTPAVYGLEHGLGGLVGTIAHHPNSWRTRDGRLWFATANGVAAVDPHDLPRNEVTPPVHIEEMEADRRSVDLGQAVELSPGRGDLTFRYTGLSLLAPDKMTFRYRLENYDADWRDAGARRVAQYTNIPPGQYTFRVTACNDDNKCNDAGAHVDFRLAPYFYQTGWFLGLCALGLVLAALGAHRLRVRAMAAQQARLEALVDERTRELKDATRALDLANRDLERRVQEGIDALREAERMAAYGQLVAAVAHEVRHPVFALQAATHVLRDRLKHDFALHDQFRTLESETNRLNVLMSDLLDFARPPELHLTPASAADLFAEAADVFRAEEHPGIRIAVDVHPGLPRVLVDRFRIIQALLNLMRNAVNHATGLTRVTLSAERAPEDTPYALRMSVADDGAGIRPDLIGRVFEPFVTSGKGTGLGLSIARRVATAHGGQVSVYSEPGRGTVFHLDLPAADSAEAAAS